MKFDLLSDLHIDINHHFKPKEANEGSKLLALCGDVAEIGYLRASKFAIFKEYKKLYEDVVYVAGNHEFYGSNYQATNRILADELGALDVKFLQPKFGLLTWELGDVVFIGGTCWTDCNRSDPLTLHGLKQCMADFTYITTTIGGSNADVSDLSDVMLETNQRVHFTPLHSVEEHEMQMKHFEHFASHYSGKKKIVLLTHHALSEKSIVSRFKDQTLMNGGFASRHEDFFDRFRTIKIHCHGHMHDPLEYKLYDTEVHCNPYGYQRYTEYKPHYGPKQLEV